MIRSLLREPLLHFLLIGAAVLLLDRVFFAEYDPERVILVDEERIEELRGTFESGQGRKPTPAEMNRLLATWLQNEVMYREARRLGLDQGDEMFRNRLVLKIRDTIFNSVVVDEPTEDDLREWFEAHREMYDKPRRYDVQQFKPDLPDDADPAAMSRAIATELHDESADETRFRMLVRRYGGRPEDNLRQLFGEGFVDALFAAPVGTWIAAESSSGWRVARVTSVGQPEPANFADAREDVQRRWLDEAGRRAVYEEISRIRDRYEVVLDLEVADVDPDAALAQGVDS
jgi:hypothetical protein